MGKHLNPIYEKGLPRNQVWQSADMNERQFMLYYDWLVQLACSRFKWENMPNTIDERFMELTINSQGSSLFFFHDDYDRYFATQAAPNAAINMYREPTGYQAYGASGFTKRLMAFTRTMQTDDIDNVSDYGVPIWNNYTRTPTIFALELYARRLANIDRAIDVNLNTQKMPIFVTCSEEQRLTVKNMVKEWMGNEPVVIGDSLSLNGINIGYVSPNVPYVCDKLYRDKMVCWSEIMSYLGIDNTSIEKGERVQSAEVKANDEQVDKSALITLDTRRWACESINRLFGLNVWVDMNIDFSSFNFAQIMTAPGGRYEHDGL